MTLTDEMNLMKVKRRRKAAICGYLFAAPWIIGFVVFTLYPVLSSLYYSFTNYNLSNNYNWIGLTNYKILFTSDHMIPVSAYNTIYYALISVPLNMVIGLLVAMMMNRKIRGINLLRTIYYMPNVVSVIAVSMLWYFIFQNNYGLLNTALRAIGIEGPNWLTDPKTAKIALIIMNCWNAGGSMIIYLAGLQGIPRNYYEAAELDGAGSARKFFSITLPLLSPSIFYNLIISIVGAFQTFSSALVMTGGGPVYSTTFYVLTLYRRAFDDNRMGYACAMAWILLIVTMGITMIVYNTLGKKVYYESEG